MIKDGVTQVEIDIPTKVFRPADANIISGLATHDGEVAVQVSLTIEQNAFHANLDRVLKV